MLHRTGRLVLGLIGLLCADPVRAQDPGSEEPAWTVRHWGLEEGLPQISVNVMAQTPDGYLWLGTYGGLARFDGLSFQLLGFQDSGVEGTRVISLAVGRGGVLWVGTEGTGLGRVVNGKLEAVPLSDDLDRASLYGLFEDSRGTLWISCESQGIVAYHEHQVFRPRQIEFRSNQTRGSRFVEDAAGRVFSLRNGPGVEKLGLESIERLDLGGLGPEVDAGLLRWGDGLLFGLSDHGLMQFQPDTGQLTPFPLLQQTDAQALHLGASGDLWVGLGPGLHRIRDGKSQWIELGEEMKTSGSVFALLEDREGSLWIGTDLHGLYRLTRSSFVTVPTPEGAGPDSVHGVTVDADGSMIFTYGCLGVFRIRDGRTEKLLSQEQLGGCAWALLSDRDGSLWVGLFNGGLWRYTQGQLQRIEAIPANTSALGLYQDRQGSVWVGTRGNGVYVLDAQGVRHFGRADGLPGADVRWITEDAEGRVFLATDGGLGIRENGQMRGLGGEAGIPRVALRFVRVDGPRLWLGTYGAGILVGEGLRFRAIDKKQGLQENVASWIEEIDGNVWWTGNQGVYRVAKSELLAAARDPQHKVYPLRYTVEDGLPSSETNGGFQPAGWRDTRNRLWIPTVRGLALLDPQKVPRNRVGPLVHIERVLLDGVEAQREPNQPLQIQASVRRLEIQYTSPSLRAPQRMYFLTRLEGLDPDWVSEGAQRSVQYSRLEPGTYRFQVKAVDESGLWSPSESSLSLVRDRAFSETWMFRLLLALSFLGAWILIHQGRTSILRRRAELLEAQVHQRTEELRTANESLKQANADLERLAFTDKLTGAWNRRQLERSMNVEMQRSKRHHRSLTLLMFDLDHFKAINDEHGHRVGDQVLIGVVKLILANVRTSDSLTRLGGDEFVLAAPETALADGLLLGEKLRALVQQHDFSPARVGITLGVAQYRPGETFEAWLERADTALYAAKKAGRNRVQAEPARPVR